jgi:hypothetical protein
VKKTRQNKRLGLIDEPIRRDFVKRRLGLAAIGSLASVLLAPLHAATESGSGDTRAHLEACTKWSERDGSFGFTNACGEPVALLFIQVNGERWFDRVVEPDERFDIGVSEKIIKETTWLFTACPAQYVPNLRFTVENQIQIAKGQYECVRK